jgi:hypothetical protein
MTSTHGRPMRLLGSTCLAGLLSVALVGGAASAQSPGGSTDPAGGSPAPTGSVAPGGSPAAGASVVPVDPAQAACDAILTSDSIAAVTGATVTSARANTVGNTWDIPDSPSCDWTLSDGTSISVHTIVESNYGSDPGGIDKAMHLGGQRVKGLPLPNAEIVFDGVANVYLGRVGPLLSQEAVFSARSADGKEDDLALLEALAAASAAQPAPVLGIDAGCAGLLGVPVVGTQIYHVPTAEGELTNIYCGYDLGDGTAVKLSVDWRDRNVMPDCCDKVKELGKGAFAQQGGSGKKAPWRLEWVLAKGDPAQVATMQNGDGATRQLSKKELIALAKTVTLPSTAGASPSPAAPAASLSPEVAPLVGTWAFPDAPGGLEMPAGLTVTLALNADGTSLVAFDCTPSKKKPLTLAGTFTADATTLNIEWADYYKGGCKSSDVGNFASPFSFAVLGLISNASEWAVAGDTLTITGTSGPFKGGQVELQRVAS